MKIFLVTLNSNVQLVVDTIETNIDSCRAFPSDNENKLLLMESISATTQSPTLAQYFTVKYRLKGNAQCTDNNLIFPKHSSDEGNCKKIKEACDWLETLPNEDYCYVKCTCFNGSCEALVKVENSHLLRNTSMCPIEAG